MMNHTKANFLFPSINILELPLAIKSNRIGLVATMVCRMLKTLSRGKNAVQCDAVAQFPILFATLTTLMNHGQVCGK